MLSAIAQSGPLASAVALALCMVALWGLSVARRDVSIVDLFWGPGFAVVALATYLVAGSGEARASLVLALVCVWALRLGVYLTWRNHGQPEDYRYQTIRARNDPGFWYKSLYIVFGTQGLLIFVVSAPVQAALSLAGGPLGLLDGLGLALWATGLFFETVGDLQLARFKGDPANRGQVMDRGLWRYTRHPNYFGDFCVWWGLYLIAAPVAPWTVFGPLIMTGLLLRVSGVALLEATITERRPAYADYVRRTPAFFPWFPKEERA